MKPQRSAFAGVLLPLPRLHRQLDTSVDHTPVYNIVQGKCLLHLVYDLPKSGIDSGLLLDDYTKFVAPGYGQRIKALRSELGLSQKKFSEMPG